MCSRWIKKRRSTSRYNRNGSKPGPVVDHPANLVHLAFTFRLGGEDSLFIVLGSRSILLVVLALVTSVHIHRDIKIGSILVSNDIIWLILETLLVGSLEQLCFKLFNAHRINIWPWLWLWL